MKDNYGRQVTYLRLSVTDLCNYRCIYCMPPEGVCKKTHGEICSLEELAEMAEAAVQCGIEKIRLTGGEPLVRRGIPELCRRLKAIPGLKELTMTTNGSLLPALAGELKAAGLDRLNLSLDTLDPALFRAVTRTGDLSQALGGLEAAEAVGFTGTRINAVLLGGVSEGAIRPLVELTRDRPLSVRFIELMPMGVCANFPQERFLPSQAVLDAVPELERVGSSGVSEVYQIPGYAGTVGLIRPMSCQFCGDCSRIRITADGKLKPCLHSREELTLRGLHGEALTAAVRRGILEKPLRHELLRDGVSHSARSMFETGG